MTTVAECMLDVVATLGGAFFGAAENGTTTTLKDSALSPSGKYNDGTLWVLSGDNAGLCVKVTTHIGDTLTLDTTLTDAIAAGDEYAVAVGSLFPLNELKAAVMQALQDQPVMRINDTGLQTAENTLRYNLPDGVSDVRRVAYLDDDDSYKVLLDWYENTAGGELVFYSQPEAGKDLILFYAGRHPWKALNEHIDGSIPMNWLKWAAVVKLYRNYIVKFRKDNPTALELFNEAKMEEARTIAANRNTELRLLPREGQYRPWG